MSKVQVNGYIQSSGQWLLDTIPGHGTILYGTELEILIYCKYFHISFTQGGTRAPGMGRDRGGGTSPHLASL